MQVHGRIWIKEDNKNFLGHGKIELLERIAQSGSIAKAAKEMKMSYKAAWDCIDLMNNVSKEPLVLRVAGGKGGGGTQVTQKGLEIIRIFRKMQHISEELFTLFEGDLNAWDSILERTKQSIQNLKGNVMLRNALKGGIIAIKEDKVYAEIVLAIDDQTRITSTIPLDSLKSLGLKVGLEAYAIIEANWIVVFTQEPKEVSLRNYICGEVSAIKEDAVNCEVLMQSDKTEFSAIITKESRTNLEIKVGQKVWFGFKSNNVILGI